MPPVLWWVFGVVALSSLVMWGYAGLPRTLWWLGLLTGSVVVAVVTLWVRDAVDYDCGLYTFADLATRLFWTVGALLFLFGVLVTGKTILDPLWSSLTGPGGYSGRYSQSYD